MAFFDEKDLENANFWQIQIIVKLKFSAIQEASSVLV